MKHQNYYIFNLGVMGSNPAGITIPLRVHTGDMGYTFWLKDISAADVFS